MISELQETKRSLFDSPVIHSYNKYVLRTYYVPGLMLGTGGFMWTKQLRFLPSGSLQSSGEGRQKNPINQCIIRSCIRVLLENYTMPPVCRVRDTELKSEGQRGITR